MRFDCDRQHGREGRRLDADTLEALRAVVGPPPATDIDWWTLRQTIVGDAGAFLDGPRRGRRWWEYAAGWIRPAVPIGVAVSVVAMLAMGSTSTPVSASTLSAVTVAADTTDGSVWLHALWGGTASTDVVDAAMASLSSTGVSGLGPRRRRGGGRARPGERRADGDRRRSTAAASGWSSPRRHARAVGGALPLGPPEGGRAPQRQFEPSADWVTKRLAEDLELTPAQRTRIDSIVTRRMTQRRELMAPIRDRMRQLLDSTRMDVDSVLTPDQRAKLEKLRSRGDGMRGPPPAGPPAGN